MITEVIPEVALLIGEPPPLPPLGPAEAQHRFNRVFHHFIGVFTQPDHPLVVFLDDLHWADSASLKLLQLLLTDSIGRALLLIGAFRENEISASHALPITLKELATAGVPIDRIVLQPLEVGHVTQLLSTTLRCDSASAAPLAALIQHKTAGNPFFVHQLLHALAQDQLLGVDTSTGRWQWDLDQLQQVGITENVADLLAGRIHKLPPATQEAIQLAACIGQKCDLGLLAIVRAQPLSASAAVLAPALEAGLLLAPTDAAMRILSADPAVSDELTNTRGLVVYTFAHDRVQQAAYALIPPATKPALHRKIGQALRQWLRPEDLDGQIFEVVNQLNAGAALLATQAEQEDLARLNLRAGQKAKAATAYSVALQYLTVGRELLDAERWAQHYDLTLALTTEAAEAAYLTTDFAQAEALAAEVLAHARTILDKVLVYEIQITAYTVQNRMSDALATTRQALELLGISLPAKPTKLHVLLGFAQTKLVLGRTPIEALADLPHMTDPTKLAVLRIFMRAVAVLGLTQPLLFPLLLMTVVRLSVMAGNAAISAFAYSLYGAILCGPLGDIPNGYRFGQLALRLMQDTHAPELAVKVNHIFNVSIRHWQEHAQAATPAFSAGLQSGLDSGDIEYACYNAGYCAQNPFLTGEPLATVEEQCSLILPLLRQLKQEMSIPFVCMNQQVVRNLMGRAQDPSSLDGEIFDVAVMLPQLQDNLYGRFCYHVYQSLLLYMFHSDPAAAIDHARRADACRQQLPAVPFFGAHNLYYSLALLAHYPHVTTREQRAYRKQIAANQRRLRGWATHAPMNYRHKYDLVEAELARVLGKDAAASAAYDRAIEGARSHGYFQEEALANELAARFYRACGRATIARVYMQAAHAGYQRWGARAKAQQLETADPHSFARNAQPPTGSRAHATSPFITSTITSSAAEASLLDLTAVMKASQALSGELVLDRLLYTLMTLVIEAAGAQHGSLILAHDGALTVAATRTTDQNGTRVQSGLPVENDPELCAAIVQYVARTHEAIVLDDAAHDRRFAREPAIMARQSKSIAALPLIHQGQLAGIVYLENTLTTGAFTPERVELLQLLSSQAAIALQNAHLYTAVQEANRTLEQKVAERTEELAQATADAQTARATAEQANELKTKFLANMSHELRTPLNAILNFTRFLSKPRYGPLTERQLELQTRVINNADHLLGLINDILDLAKIEAGRMDLFLEETDLLPLLRGVMATATGLTKEKGLDLMLDVPDTLPLVWIDKTRIRQVLLNLLSNAAKFTEQGGITLRVSSELRVLSSESSIAQTQNSELKTQNWVVVEVRDTGVGIVPEHLALVFEEFHQIDGALPRQHQGTGLGLPISKQLVEMHGGGMWVESTPGVGSTFAFSLPLTPARAPATDQPSLLPASTDTAGILIH